MTVPVERTRAVLNTRQFLFDLLDPKKTPRVRRAIRQRASDCLRHYPSTVDMICSSDKLPQVWGRVSGS